MAVTVESFKLDFPEFSTLPSSSIEHVINRAKTRLDANIFRCLYDDAVGYLAAHLLAKQSTAKKTAGFAAGRLTNIKIDGYGSMGFQGGATGSQLFDDYDSTFYGQSLKQIIESSVVPIYIF